MIHALRRWWEGYKASIPKSEFADSIPESEWDRPGLRPAVSKARRKAYGELLALVFAHLPPQEAARRVDGGNGLLNHMDEVDIAFRDALFPDNDDDPAARQQRGFIACDWKAQASDVQWQADLLCKAHQVPGRWAAPSGDLEQALHSLGEWLRPQGLALLCVDAGDSVIAFALPTDRVAPAVALGKKLTLGLRSPGDT